MYLSHYVDIPPAYLGGCKKNDESPYYANWITNDDRDVYDSFLRVLDGLNKMEDFRNLLNTVKDTKSNINNNKDLELIELGEDDLTKKYNMFNIMDKSKNRSKLNESISSNEEEDLDALLSGQNKMNDTMRS